MKADDAATRERRRRELREWESRNEIVPGTATWHRSEGGQGGQDWEGLARMARARQAAGVELDSFDRQALARHPSEGP